jgi:hypothetical protein
MGERNRRGERTVTEANHLEENIANHSADQTKPFGRTKHVIPPEESKFFKLAKHDIPGIYLRPPPKQRQFSRLPLPPKCGIQLAEIRIS